MKLALNTTKKSSERYTLIDGKMGCAGEAANHANNHFEVVTGSDRGNGYQGYQSVSYFLNENKYAPQEAKAALKHILRQRNLVY